MDEETWDGDCTLGPFFDSDGTEILPCTTPATDELLADCMGWYGICSNVPVLDGTRLLLCNRRLTQYIQEGWNTSARKGPTDAFLLAYQSPHKALGRLTEEVICKQVLTRLLTGGDLVGDVWSVAEACREGLLVRPAKGCRSDDLLMIHEGHPHMIIESKASFTGTAYLDHCLPKALAQLRATATANPDVQSALLILTAIREKHTSVARAAHAELLDTGSALLAERARSLLRPS